VVHCLRRAPSQKLWTYTESKGDLSHDTTRAWYNANHSAYKEIDRYGEVVGTLRNHDNRPVDGDLKPAKLKAGN
jgi:hypothetical protein